MEEEQEEVFFVWKEERYSVLVSYVLGEESLTPTSGYMSSGHDLKTTHGQKTAKEVNSLHQAKAKEAKRLMVKKDHLDER
ncbi:MAG: hypothetical protein GY820_00065, partial [Gammaproteobacteria bacterium]|nr:hypothetical protein [Gammaproteobacteria bacterium]